MAEQVKSLPHGTDDVISSPGSRMIGRTDPGKVVLTSTHKTWHMRPHSPTQTVRMEERGR